MRRFFERFRRDEEGNVLLVFGIAMVPLIGIAGAAVDYDVAANRHLQLQVALDQATLTIARDPPSSDLNAVTARVSQLMTAQLAANGVSSSDWRLTRVEDTGPKVTVAAESTVKTHFVTLLNIPRVTVSTSAEVTREQTRLEIALVLDNSSSMATVSAGRQKVEAAKEAANALVDTLFQGKTTSDFVKISVVPYTSTVTVGSEYATAPWVDRAGVSSIHWQTAGGVNATIEKPSWATSRFDLFDQLGISWAGCFETRPNGLGFTDDAASSAVPDSLFVPMLAPDEPGAKPQTNTTSLTTYNDRDYYNSYLKDDGGDCSTLNFPTNALQRQKQACKYRINKDSSKIGLTTRFGGIKTGPNFMCNGVPLLRMKNERDTVKARIGQLQALGDTTMFEGIAWGWRTLSPNTPFQDGRPYNTLDNKKILILLTDGNNNWLSLGNDNRSLYSPMSYYWNNRLATGITSQTTANTTLNQKTKDVCANAKRKGVIIYTVGLMVDGQSLPADWSDVVNGCASTVEGKLQAYIAKDGNQLVQVFKTIGSELSKLRISR